MFEKIAFITLLTAFILLLAFIDKKYHLGLTTSTSSKVTDDNLSSENKELKARVEVLERIVTEPKYELNKAIRNLES